ncbi:hypothetical protein KAW08_00265 [bacterium]|nr:hypothetical protein [bacterium]
MNNIVQDQQSEGNGTVLLLADSSDDKAYSYVEETMLAALGHLGIPYKIRDIETDILSRKELLEHSCVILGQNCLGKKLGQKGAEILRDAVGAGVGLVSFDGDLGSYSKAFFEIFRINIGRTPLLCSDIKTVNVEHYITGTRELDDDVTLYKPLEVWPIESPHCGSVGKSLLQTSNNWPVLIASTHGQGRAVLFTGSVKLWIRDILGHASGLDDVFWKSIVWAARKPFAIYAMPPFATALVDDCSGSYNHFRYVDTMNKYGWLPHVSIFLENIDRVIHQADYADSAKMKALYDAGLAEFSVHGFTYENLAVFNHRARKPLSDEQIVGNFKRIDAYFKKWGITPSRWQNYHFCEMGTNAFPYMKERGVEYLHMELNPDTAWLDVPDNKPAFRPPKPYHHRGFYMDYLEQDTDFFIFHSMLNPWGFDSPDFVQETDFLWNHTIFWDESPCNNVEDAARIGIKQIRRGIDARFFGYILCHEQRVAVVSMKEWDKILGSIHDGLKKYDLIYRAPEYILDYARSHYDTRIADVSVNNESGKVHCKMQGKTRLTTALEVYINNENSVQCELCDIPQFTGTVNVKMQCPLP